MIYGVGVDTVDTQRFAAKLAANQALAARLLTPAERKLRPEQQAARFAAKEALIKAFGGSAIKNSRGEIVCELGWQDIEVPATNGHRPGFSATAGLNKALQAAGVSAAHLSLSHDGGQAVAFVTLESSFTDTTSAALNRAGQTLQEAAGAAAAVFKKNFGKAG